MRSCAKDQLEYLDVGTNIGCRLHDSTELRSLANDVSLNVKADVSNLASEQRGQPVIRQLRIEASTIVELRKTTVVGIVDDPNSKRQFQLEVTVTRLKLS